MSRFDLKKLCQLPSGYEEHKSYIISAKDIEKFGVNPPYRPVGFNRKVENEPFILLADGKKLVLPDVEKNHEAIRQLQSMFGANAYLAKAKTIPPHQPLTWKQMQGVDSAHHFLSKFEQKYG